MTGRGVPGEKARFGFTLLELLVALAIFALLSALGYTGLQSLLRTQAATTERSRDFARLTRALVLLQNDVGQALARPIRDNQGDTVVPMVADAGTNPTLELTREGWLNLSQGETPMLQRIGYRFDGERLIRRSWPVLDRAPDTAPRETLALPNVKSIQLRFLDTNGSWQPSWPPAAAQQALPRAMELRLELRDWGSIRRLFRVPGA